MGEADNKNYKALSKFFPISEIISPQLDYKNTSPESILENLSELVNSDDFIFTGQSLGGWYADKLSIKYSRPCILTNPCYFPHRLDIIVNSGIPCEFTEEYGRLSEHEKNMSAYVLCSNADTVIPENYSDCTRLAYYVKTVNGGHSSIENLSEELEELFGKING